MHAFAKRILINLGACFLATLPWLVLDAIHVLSGQPYESALLGVPVAIGAAVLSLAILFLANWVATKERRSFPRVLWSFLAACVALAVMTVPGMLLLYWFHFLIGGHE